MVGNMYRICCFNVVGVFAFCFASSGTAEERVMEEATGGGGNQTAYEKENTPRIRARRDRAQQSLAVKAFVEKFTVIPQGGKMALEMSSTRTAFDSRSPETIITCLRWCFVPKCLTKGRTLHSWRIPKAKGGCVAMINQHVAVEHVLQSGLKMGDEIRLEQNFLLENIAVPKVLSGHALDYCDHQARVQPRLRRLGRERAQD